MGCLGGCFGRAWNSGERQRFLAAAKQGDDHAAAASLAHNPDVVTSTTLLQRKTALHLAAEKGHSGVMASILEMLLLAASGAETLKDDGSVKGVGPGSDAECQVAAIINSRDSDGCTPLIVACGHGHSDCARLLLSNGAWREPTDTRGNSAMHYAAAKGYLGILLSLLTEFQDELKAEQERLRAPEPDLPCLSRLVNAQNSAGFAPLSYAVWAKQSGAVQVLLQHGAGLLLKNQRTGMETSIPCPAGSTPLHLAAMRGHIEISRILLKTHYERVMEPMQLQLAAGAGAGESTEAVARAMLEVDPRTQVNGMGLVPYKVAQRAGFMSLASLLRPHIPLARLFNEEEHRQRFYGPPALKLLAAEALNRKLIRSLEGAVSRGVTLVEEIAMSTPPRRTSIDNPSYRTEAVPMERIFSNSNAGPAPSSTRPGSLTTPIEPRRSHDGTGSFALRQPSLAGIPALSTVREDEENAASGGGVASTSVPPAGATNTTIQRAGRQCTSCDSPAAGCSSSCSGTSTADSPFANTTTQPSSTAPAPPQLSSPVAAGAVSRALADAAEAGLGSVPLPGHISSQAGNNKGHPWSNGGSPARSFAAGSHQPPVAGTGSVAGVPMRRATSSASGTTGNWPGRTANTVQISPRGSGPIPAMSMPPEDGSMIFSSALSPGVFALHQGGSIILRGAASGSHTGSMAQVMGLSELSSVIEDRALPRMRGASCIRLSHAQLQLDDEDVDPSMPPLDPMEARLPLSPQQSLEHHMPDISLHPLTPTGSHVPAGSQPSPSAAGPSNGAAMRVVKRTLSAVSSLRRSMSGTREPQDMEITAASMTGPGPEADVEHDMIVAVPLLELPMKKYVAPPSEDDEHECGVCLEHPALVLVQPCNHAMCAPCAKKMLSLGAQRTPHCPFCRSLICDFECNREACEVQARF